MTYCSCLSHLKCHPPSFFQAVLVEETRENSSSTIELVRCKLTLFYDYWQMNEILETLLPEGMIIPSAFETVGHIAHLNLKDEHLPYKNVIAKVVLDKKKPKIQTVVNKIDVIQNDYRKMQLEVLAGNHSLVTTVVENGLRFRVDLAKVYWNSRLGTERQRLLSGFDRNDVICDVFSGGPIAISAAKIVKRVYANDLNPFAVEYLVRNICFYTKNRVLEFVKSNKGRKPNGKAPHPKKQPQRGMGVAQLEHLRKMNETRTITAITQFPCESRGGGAAGNVPLFHGIVSYGVLL
ncbi:tRNA (guanine(37)-N1)-methyltransferase 1-like, partial [Hibiscus syriacus]|uniref:tRNA (guanine(37)-N1)-methyltransferase 1-like n=1 Tax=Hibiscus syriacus TaxID=106335 RepID=UPI0019221DF7